MQSMRPVRRVAELGSLGATMKSHRHVLRLAWLTIPLLTGCGESNTKFISRISQYREPLNSVRIAKGIPPVPADWVPRRDRSAAAWDKPEFARNRTAPAHQYKFLTFSDPFYDKGTLVSETDHYESGKRWNHLDAGTLHEYLDITYSFDLEHRGSPPWKVELRRFGSNGLEQISLAEAEQVLKSWLPTHP